MSKVSAKYSVVQGENLFSEVQNFFEVEKSVEISFTAPDLSSLGGLILVSKAEKSCGIINSISRCITDWRNPDLIHHTIRDMVGQRVMQIACGYEDADDCDTLRNDSMLKMSCGRVADGKDLCSQPTMTRLENHLSHRELYEIGEAFINNFIKSYGDNIPSKIILDLDDSNVNTYGSQQLTLFNQYYGEYCYMPLFIFEGYSGRLVLPILRPGRTNKQLNVFGIIRRLVERIQKVWPNVSITVRGDAMFCSHDMFEWADDQRGVHYCVGLTGNQVLRNNPIVLNLLAKAESDFKRTSEPIKLFSQFQYAAKTWKANRWVIVKVEYSALGTNIRYIVTDKTPKNNNESKNIYEKFYCRRGECELWIKELKDDLRIDRMSCGKFSANQFRTFLHAAAYILLWHIRKVQLKDTEADQWTTRSLQLRILKSAVRITSLKTKIKIEFGRDHPERCLIELALRRAA
jgi:Transposase DDE domain group 1